MGSSYTEFRGKGFWSWDNLLQAWLCTMSLQMSGRVGSSDWQHKLRDTWLLTSHSCGSGCVSASLDEFLTDRERVEVVLEVVEGSIERLRTFGPFVAAPFVNLAGGGLTTVDWPIEWFELIADTFARLLRGEITTDLSTGSPTLPWTRTGQKMG